MLGEVDGAGFHPRRGYEALAGQGGFPPEMLDVILHHHELLDEWRELSLVLGERVSVTRRGGSFDGTVFALEDDGGIVVRLGDGRQAKLLPHEDVSLIPLGVWRSS